MNSIFLSANVTVVCAGIILLQAGLCYLLYNISVLIGGKTLKIIRFCARIFYNGYKPALFSSSVKKQRGANIFPYINVFNKPIFTGFFIV